MSEAGRGEDPIEREIRDEVRKKLSARKPAGRAFETDDVRQAIVDVAQTMAVDPPRQAELVASVLADLVGLGPLEELLSREGVQEILVNGHEEIFVEQAGQLERHPGRFRDRAHLDAVIERLAAMAGQTVHELKPFAEGALPNGARLHVVVPPMATRGPLVSIRLFPDRLLSMEDLTGWCGTVPPPIAAFLDIAVRGKTSLLISGAAGTGKTTLMNALARTIPREERVVTLESTPELRLDRPNWAALASSGRSPTGEFGPNGLRELVRHALRLRPDRILIGECLGAEAFELIQAMNTGHAGCMTTLHAHSPAAALDRLLTLALTAGVPIAPETLGRQAAAHLRLVVQLARGDDGQRRLIEIASVSAGTSGAAEVRTLARRADGESSWDVPLREGDLPREWRPDARSRALCSLRELT